MINKYWQHYQKIIAARYNLIRAKFSHAGNKGSCAETALRELLNECLPNNLFIGHGEIIDSSDRRSCQIDIAVASNELLSFAANCHSPNIFIIESVLAAGEIKYTITKTDDLITKCNAFKQLSPKSLNGDMRHANHSDIERFYDKRPFFVFALESNITIPTIIEQLEKSYKNSPINQQIDAVFIVDKGAIINFGNGKGERSISIC